MIADPLCPYAAASNYTLAAKAIPLRPGRAEFRPCLRRFVCHCAQALHIKDQGVKIIIRQFCIRLF